ncbi:MAG: response regulator [Planctomycetes bacterium]|nr:response regulator [Planctomycetota bacterium]
MRPRLATPLRWLVFGLLLLLTCLLREEPSAALDQAIVWLPTGVAVAGLYLLGIRAAAVVAVATLWQRWLLDYDWSVGVTAAAASTAEAVLGALLLRWLRFAGSLGRLRDMFAVFASATVAPLASILCTWLGRAFVYSDPLLPFCCGWGGWWRMNALGVITVVPFAASWLGAAGRRFARRDCAEFAAGLLGVAALLLGLFALLPAGAAGVMWLDLLLVAGAMSTTARCSMRLVTLGTMTATLVVAWATARGFGPFAQLPAEQVHVVTQLFALLLVAIPPVFAALLFERRDAMDRVRRNEELLAAIHGNVKDGLFRTDPELRLLHGNLALARMFGHGAPEDLPGRSLGDAIVDGERRTLLLRRARERGQWRNEEIEFRCAGGSTFWGLTSGTGVRDARGAIVHFDGVITDVTDRRSLEARGRQAQKMEALGKLAGGVAHDFNNLLTVIVGYAQTIQAAPDCPAPVRDDACAVLDAARRAAGLTRQLLACSRRQMLSPQVLDLAAVVDRMAGMLRRLVGEHIRLTTEHRSGPCWVCVDPSQLEQVLLNLAVNARDAMRDGGLLTVATGHVEVDDAVRRAHPECAAGSHVLLQVRDSGVGMTAEVLAQAFDPFFTTKGRGGGTGLGLATVHGIVRQSGGGVWLDSAPGAGTTASILLPRRAAPPAAKTVAPPAVAPAMRRSTVLVVEDEPAVRALLCQTLAGEGHRVLEAADGAQGLAAALADPGPIDLVVTDVVMPVMGGLEMVRRLRERRPGQRVLFVSGYPEDGDAPGEPGGLDGELLAKPFTREQLLARIAALP